MELTGILIVKKDTKQVSDKFKSREFVIETADKYPQTICLQLSQNNVTAIDIAKVGDEIKVHYNLRGRAWTNPQGETKYFNTIEAWKIEILGKGNNITNDDIANENAASDDFIPTGDSDGLPF